MTLNVNSLLCRNCYAYCDETAKAIESSGFRDKVALYLSYLYIKLTTKLEGNPFEFQAQFLIIQRVKLNWRLD